MTKNNLTMTATKYRGQSRGLKQQAFGALIDLIAEMDDFDDSNKSTRQKQLIGKLYAFLSPYKKVKGLSPSNWVMTARSKDRSKPYIQEAYVKNNKLVATDGHILFLIPLHKDFKDGYYDSEKRLDDMDKYNFPDFSRVIPDYNISEKEFAIRKNKITLIGNVECYILEADNGDPVYINCEFMDKALNGHKLCRYQAKDALSPVLIKDEIVQGSIAVLMPIRG